MCTFGRHPESTAKFFSSSSFASRDAAAVAAIMPSIRELARVNNGYILKPWNKDLERCKTSLANILKIYSRMLEIYSREKLLRIALLIKGVRID